MPFAPRKKYGKFNEGVKRFGKPKEERMTSRSERLPSQMPPEKDLKERMAGRQPEARGGRGRWQSSVKGRTEDVQGLGSGQSVWSAAWRQRGRVEDKARKAGRARRPSL